MTMKEDGGQAFPGRKTMTHQEAAMQYGTGYNGLLPEIYIDGMSLRDYFAGQALTGLLAHDCRNQEWERESAMLAKRIYELADAMLIARKKEIP